MTSKYLLPLKFVALSGTDICGLCIYPRYDIGGSDDIRLNYNPCGCVYTMDVDERLWITKMYTLTCGYVIAGDDENKCGLVSLYISFCSV